jgi:hypothetical protein
MRMPPVFGAASERAQDLAKKPLKLSKNIMNVL